MGMLTNGTSEETNLNTVDETKRNIQLVAYMSDYPSCDYCDAELTDEITEFPRGKITIYQRNFNEGGLWIHVNMRGIPANCESDKNDYAKNGCGVHIHAGMTCSNANLVQGHYWNKEKFGEGDANDPWILYEGEGGNNGPAIQYDSNEEGEAKSNWIFMSSGNGYNADENVHHAVVVHDANGARKACGVLNWD